MGSNIETAKAEAKAKVNRFNTELEALYATHGEDENAWPAGVSERFNRTVTAMQRALNEYEALSDRGEHIAAVRQAALHGGGGNIRLEAGTSFETYHGRPDGSVRAYAGLDRVGSVHELDGLRARALDLVEHGDGLADRTRSMLTEMLDRDAAGVHARYLMAIGNPAYRSAWEKWVRSPMTAHMALSPTEAAAWRDVEAVRSAMSESNTSAVIPLVIDPTITLTNTGAISGVRDYATLRPTTSNSLRAPVTTGITAEWKSEGAAAADASPTITGVDIPVYQGFAYVVASYELADDFNLGTHLAELFMDAKMRKEADAFITGAGSTEPYGILTRVAATTASRVSPTTAGTFSTSSVADVYKVRDALPVRHRSSAGVAWFSNIAISSVISQMATGTNSGPGGFWNDLTQDVPPTLLGKRWLEATAMTSVVTTGSNILLMANAKDYIITDRIGASVEYIPNVMDQATGRPTGQRGWAFRWRSGGDLVNTDAGRVLQL